MHSFAGPILKFDSKGEKTGWTYLPIPADIIKKLKLKDKKGFRIKGSVDDVRFEKMSTYPMGGGEFIIAINSEMRKKLGKKEKTCSTFSIAIRRNWQSVAFLMLEFGFDLSLAILDCFGILFFHK